MPSSFTPLLKLELPATGELSGTWGTTVNNAITTPLSEAVAGTTTITVGGSDYTLSNGDGSAANEARKMFIVATGTPGASRNVICPAASKFYVFRNDTNQTLTLKTLSGTGIAVPAGQYRFLYCNGTDVVETFNAMASLTLGTALAAASGGTGQSSYTAGDLLYATGTTALSKLGIGAANRVLTSSGTAPQWVTSLTGLTGVSSSSITNTSLTPTRLVYSTTGGAQTDSANLTFDGTSLTLGGNPTLSAGTANGVLYLNGSKVATSGSALTFDGTNLSASRGITVNSGGIATSGFYNGVNISGYDALGWTGSSTLVFGGYRSTQWGDIAFYTGGSEQMRLTSTGLGIGTSSPGYKLQVAGAGAVAEIVASNTAGAERIHLLSRISAGVSYVQSQNAQLLVGTFDNYAMQLMTNNTTRMLLDTSGNLGIGTSSPATKLHVDTGAAGYGLTLAASSLTARRFQFGIDGSANLAVYDTAAAAVRMTLDGSGNLGIGTTSPSEKLEVNGNIRLSGRGATFAFMTPDWRMYNSSSGNALVWDNYSSEQMRLDSSGNLGIGTNSPSRKLDVQGAPLSVGGNGTGVLANFVNNTTAFNASPTAAISLWNRFNSGGSTFPSAVVQGGKENTTDGNYAGYLSLQTTDAGGTSNERMRLDSSGNLGLGVTPSAWSGGPVIQIGGASSAALFSDTNNTNLSTNAYYNGSWRYQTSTVATSRFQSSDGVFRWYTAPSGTAGNAISFTQAMTLDASGNLGVGVTNPAAKLEVYGGASGTVTNIQVGNAATGFVFGVDSSNNCQIRTAQSVAILFYTASIQRASIPAAGGMVVGTAALATTATDGFLYVPTCAGTPTGTPTTQTGTAPIVVDTTNNKLYFYSGGQWRDAGP